MRLTEETAQDLAAAIADLSSINLTGLDEVWGSLGYASTSMDELTKELRSWRKAYCRHFGLEFEE